MYSELPMRVWVNKMLASSTHVMTLKKMLHETEEVNIWHLLWHPVVYQNQHCILSFNHPGDASCQGISRSTIEQNCQMISSNNWGARGKTNWHGWVKGHWPKIDTKWHRADSRFVPSQWETSFSQWEMALQSNDVSHWLGTSLESALVTHTYMRWKAGSTLPYIMTWHQFDAKPLSKPILYCDW